MTRRLLLVGLLPLVLRTADRDGIRPRSAAADYTAHAGREGIAVGAALLTPDQVRKTFVSDLYRSYTVVEIGVFPNGPLALELEPDAFLLRAGGAHKTVRPASPRAVAGVLQKTAPNQSDVAVYPSVGVGYESGPRTYDPVTGGTRGGGWRTSAGVGVGVGGTRPASTDPDRRTMELELSEKGLPAGSYSKPVAGYLYFPLPPGKNQAKHELEYDSPAGKIVLKLR